jgi:AraC-like DNA-binding protein
VRRFLRCWIKYAGNWRHVTWQIPNHPLSEIAGVLGFSELSAFSRWFSRLFDCSPSSFRRFNAL